MLLASMVDFARLHTHFVVRSDHTPKLSIVKCTTFQAATFVICYPNPNSVGVALFYFDSDVAYFYILGAFKWFMLCHSGLQVYLVVRINNRMSNRTIEPISGENTSLELHTELCAARYQQITDSLNTIDLRLIQMESDLGHIRESILAQQGRLDSRVTAWGTAIIVSLTGMVAWLTVHYVLP